MWEVCDVSGSGSKLKSNGWAPVSDVWMFVRSMSSLVFVLMYPAVARAGCSPSAQVSLIMSCAVFLLILRHLKV